MRKLLRNTSRKLLGSCSGCCSARSTGHRPKRVGGSALANTLRCQGGSANGSVAARNGRWLTIARVDDTWSGESPSEETYPGCVSRDAALLALLELRSRVQGLIRELQHRSPSSDELRR
jgi:hypothetical protein